MVGLDAAGKTTILYRLQLGEVQVTIPTIGFNVETLTHKKIELTCWDVGGRDKIRGLYRHYYQYTEGIIFVVDSHDRERCDIAKDQLHSMLTEEQLQDVPVLIFCNKQDLPTAKSVSEITENLGLNSVRNRPWYIQACCAKDGEGLFEGLDWLVTALAREKTKVEAAPTSTFKVDPKKQRGKRTEKSSTVSTDNSQSVVSKFLRLIL